MVLRRCPQGTSHLSPPLSFTVSQFPKDYLFLDGERTGMQGAKAQEGTEPLAYMDPGVSSSEEAIFSKLILQDGL